METRGWLLLGCFVACLRLVAACGPGALPAFANPPPDDAAVARDASDDEDAGSVDAGPHEVDSGEPRG